MSETIVNGVRFIANIHPHPDLSQYTQSRVSAWVREWAEDVTGLTSHLRGIRVWTPGDDFLIPPFTGVLVTLYGRYGHCVTFFGMEGWDKPTMLEGLSGGLAKIVDDPKSEKRATA